MMTTAINLLSVIPMRKEPSHRSEMVSQLLFGECAAVMEEQKDFVRIKGLYDGYEGWVQANQLMTTAVEVETPEEFVGLFTCEVLISGIKFRVPYGSPVHHNNEDYSFMIEKKKVEYLMKPDEVWHTMKHERTKENLGSVYSLYVNAPYLWGGKSIFGIDCSGFAQQVLKMFGVKLLRDAYLQAEQGRLIENFEESRLGDLAFFHNENGKVVHVGIILDHNQIVHASGKVRIDTIDEKGIVNSETGKRTHHLHSRRRYF